jgi:fructose-1,6-bisphosphatase/sedoheptulose 1,7-bisphosphatase-like protein
MSKAPNDRLVGPINPAIFDIVFDAPLSMCAIASAVAPIVGTADDVSVRGIKKLIDATAGSVFEDELAHWTRDIAIATSEAKDEFGDAQPGSVAGSSENSRLRLAVDVIDGTLPAALGLPGAYSICAVADGLQRFPDLQAYAVLAPEAACASIDLSSRPEDSIIANMQAIAGALGKPVNELTIVCHSTDTGVQHTKLIELMRSHGIKVVVPEPVIVEPPYVAAACMRLGDTKIDGMIGVFGLPEIAINTVLAGVLNRGWRVLFRIASNQPLKNRTATSLDGIFEFSNEELALLRACELDGETVYDYERVTADGGGVFAGAAITDDPILNLSGAVHADAMTNVHAWLADPCGNAHEIYVQFHRPTEIDYTARYSQPLFDISLVAPLESAEAGLFAVERLEHLTRELRHIVPGIYIQPRSDSRDGRVGLHVTLTEFIVEHFAAINDEDGDDFMRNATDIVTVGMRSISAPLMFSIDRVHRTPTGVQALVTPDQQVLDLIEALHREAARKNAFAGMREPPRFHVTLARFTEIPADLVVERIEAICDDFNRMPFPDVYVRQVWLRRATATPFHKITRDVAFFIAD